MRSCKSVRHLIRERTADMPKARALILAAVRIALGKRAQVVRVAAPCALLPELGRVRATAMSVASALPTNAVHVHRAPMSIVARAIRSITVIANRFTKKAAPASGRAKIALHHVAPMCTVKCVRPLAEPMLACVLRGSARRMWAAAPIASVHAETKA